MSTNSQNHVLQEYYGDIYPVLRDLLGRDSRTEEYLSAIQAHLEVFKFRPKTTGSRLDLKKFADSLYKAEKLLEKYPDIPYQLIYTENEQLPDFIPPLNPASPQELHAILRHFSTASRRALDGHHMLKRRRPPEIRKFMLLKALVFEYIRVFQSHPPCSRESKFHELVGYLLRRAGYTFSSENPIIEDMLRLALSSAIAHPPPI